MDSAPGSSTKFWVTTVMALLLGTAGVAVLWRLPLSVARQQSANLTAAGDNETGAEALTNFQLAVWLNPSNKSAFAGLAAAQIQNGQPNQALESISHAGHGPAVTRLQVRTLMELGRGAQAANAATRLTSTNSDADDMVLASLALAQVGRTGDIAALMPRVTSPEALTHIKRMEQGKLPLAAELSAAGLLNSSAALLNSLPPSFERNLLLARIYYTRTNPTNLLQAVELLNQAIAMNPSDPNARRLLSDIYTEQGNTNAATTQTMLINKIQAGRP